jgi:ABC-type glycerol-3-phosphate transport system substrate-binding protein
MRPQVSRRDFLRLSATGVAGALLVACAPAAPAGQPAAGGEPAAAGGELRFIKLAMSEPEEAYFTGTAVPQFEELNPGYTVTVDMSDWGHLGEKMLTSFAGNLPIDLVETGSDWVGPYARRNQFMPLDDFVEAGYNEELADFYPDMVAISVYQDQLMGLPYILDIRTTVYRKDHFEEVGLDPEKGPDNWEELVEFGQKLVQTDAQGNITRAGYNMNASDPTNALFEYWYMLVQNGTDIVVPWGSWELDDIAFNGPDGVEALQFLYDLVHKYKITPLTGVSAKTPNLTPLAEGMASIDVDGSSAVGNWKLYQPDKIDLLGIGVPLMHKDRKQYACPNIYAIGTNTKDPEGAWKLMTHMVSREIMTGMLSQESWSPPRKSIAAEAEYMQDPLLQKYQQIPEEGWGATTPQAVDFPTLELVGNYVQAALRDEMGIQEALDKAVEEVRTKVEEALQA